MKLSFSQPCSISSVPSHFARSSGRKAFYVKKGFTIVELLVVVGIIAVLAAVVVMRLSSSKNKGVNAAIVSRMVSAKAQANLYADANRDSYADVCTEDAEFMGYLDGASDAFNGTADADKCIESGSAYAAAIPVRGGFEGGEAWCIDSLDNAKAITLEEYDNLGSACP